MDAELVSLTIGAGAISALGMFISDFGGLYSKAKCKFYECCKEPWIRVNTAKSVSGFELDVEERLYGQHIAQKTVITAVRAHISKPRPNKALVMSFHGPTGSGKNYLTKMIARALYKKEMRSQFVHLFVATLHFPHQEETEKYKQQLRTWISGNLTLCEQSMFIFDEMDKLPIQLLDAIIPFIDFYDRVNGVDPRKSVFIFLSNGGSNVIAQRTLEYYNMGKPREQISLKELEELVQISAFNEGEGGLKTSRLISKHLVDYFVPFLPLERKHVMMCFKDYLRYRRVNYAPDQLEELMDSLLYFPKGTPVFSTSGCKQVEQKADFMLADTYRSHQQLAQLHDDDF